MRNVEAVPHHPCAENPPNKGQTVVGPDSGNCAGSVQHNCGLATHQRSQIDVILQGSSHWRQMTVSQKLSLGWTASHRPSFAENPPGRLWTGTGTWAGRDFAQGCARDIKNRSCGPLLHATVVPIEGQHPPSLNLRAVSLFCHFSAFLTASASGIKAEPRPPAANSGMQK